MLPSFYNNEYQIVQTPAASSEPYPAMDGRLSGALGGQHIGGGYGEFHRQKRFRGADENLHLTERFRYR